MSSLPNTADMTVEQRVAILEALIARIKIAAREAAAAGDDKMQLRLLTLSRAIIDRRLLDHKTSGLAYSNCVDEAVRLLSEFQLSASKHGAATPGLRANK